MKQPLLVEVRRESHPKTEFPSRCRFSPADLALIFVVVEMSEITFLFDEQVIFDYFGLVLRKFKLAAVDLDDTLLGPDKSISPENRQAVEELQGAGLHVALASGRTAESMRRYYQELGLTGPLITNNGAFVLDPISGESLLRIMLPGPLASHVIQEGLDRGYSIICTSEHDVYASEESPWVKLYMGRTGRKTISYPLPDDLPARGIIKTIWLSSPATIKEAFVSARGLFGESMNYMITEPEYVEFMEKHADKEAGLKAVAEFYGIAQAEVIAFGDNNNDVGMLRWAGVGIAVGNANESARRAADFTGPGSGPNAFALALASFLNQGGSGNPS
jgi:Cof subfamily protein (haloacid dehalogenase superfamily)